MTDELRNQLDQQIDSYDIYTRIYKDHIESCMLFDMHDNVRIVGARNLTMSSKPLQVFIAITDDEFDGGTDFQCFGSNAILVLPKSIYEEMFENHALMGIFDRAFADRLEELPYFKCTGETGIVEFMRTKIKEMKEG